MKVTWSPLAIDRVVEIADGIAKDNAIAAEKWIQKIFVKTGQLARFPESGHHLPETSRRDIRELVCGSYRIIYRVEPRLIAILTVRHARQVLPLDELT